MPFNVYFSWYFDIWVSVATQKYCT